MPINAATRWNVAAVLSVLTWMGVLTQPAVAAFTICNRTFDVANVAIGREERGQISTRGWWRIGPNQCAEVIRETLDVPSVYIFALDVFGRELLPGAVPLCVGTGRFTIRGRDDCLVRGHLEAAFIEVETGGAQAWRMFLAPTPE